MFIIPGAKFAKKVDVNSALSQAIASAKGPDAASQAAQACQTFQRLRSAVHEAPTTDEAAAGLRRYVSAVEHAQRHVPNTASLNVALLWVNGFNGNDHCETGDLALDRVAAVFNIGVCEARLGAAAFARGGAEACTTAARRFRASAGYFRLAAELPAAAQHTEDLSYYALQAVMYAMLGNGQQMLYQHFSASGSKSSIVAMFAAGARDFYDLAAETCRGSGLAGGAVDKLVGECARALKAYFDLVAQARQAEGYHEKNDMSQELPQLDISNNAAQQALKSVRLLPAEGGALAWVGKLKEDLVRETENWIKRLKKKTEEAEELNRRLYFASRAKNMPPVVGRRSLEAGDMRKLIDAESGEVLRLLGEFP